MIILPLFNIAFLSSLSKYDPRYSLIPPFQPTDVYEFHNWTFRGSAIPMKKKFLRLTSPIVDSYGAICQRVPTLFKDWTVEFELLTQGNKIGGESIEFVYSQELCPELPIQWNGFILYINTTSNSSDCSVFIIPNDGMTLLNFSNSIKIGTIPLRNQDSPVILRIARSGNHISISTKKSMNSQQANRLFDYTFPNLIDYGYFTITALGSPNGNSQDLYSFYTYHNGYDRSEFDYPIDYENRKVLEMAAEERRVLKRQRRKKMVNVQKIHEYIESQNLQDSPLTGETVPNISFKDSLNMIKEILDRGDKMVTSDELKLFISQHLRPVLNSMKSKRQTALSNFDDLKENIDDIWGDLHSKLRDLSVSAGLFMENLQVEIFSAAQSIKIPEKDSKQLEKAVAQQNLRSSMFQQSLYVIMFLELLFYLNFLRRNWKTHQD